MSKEENLSVELELTPKHLDVISHALELYCRLQIGQFDLIDWLFHYSEHFNDIDRKKAKIILEELRKTYFPDLSPHSSYGIGSAEVPQNAKIAYEINKLIRYEQWLLDDERTIMNVDSYPPRKISDEPMPNVNIKKGK